MRHVGKSVVLLLTRLGALALLCCSSDVEPPDVDAGCSSCGESCGDGVCAEDESCTSCQEDCGSCSESCGDGVCAEDESCTSCEEDCGSCPSPGNVYYMATDGNDDNPGTATAPFATWESAESVLRPGDTLRLLAGTYDQRIRVSTGGTADAYIIVEADPGANAIIRGPGDRARQIVVEADYVVVRGLEVDGLDIGICVELEGQHIYAEGLNVHECNSHGVHVNMISSDVVIRNSVVYRACLSNEGREPDSGWPSGVKVRGAEHVLIEGNEIFHNWGEGVGARGHFITVRRNLIYDNFSVNLYGGNTGDSVFEQNIVICDSSSSGEPWFRDGHPAVGIALAEEFFDDMGPELANTQIINNIVDGCRRGFAYNGADYSSGGGLDHVTIANNTFLNITDRGILIQEEPDATRGSIIANNIAQSVGVQANVKPETGVLCYSNFWVGSDRALGCADSSNISGDPLLVEQYYPGAGSPVIDAGADLGIPRDLYGATRVGLPDIGAVESR